MYDIVIVGAGFSGLTLANYLATKSSFINIAILEKSNILNIEKQNDGRNFAISASSISLFKEMGIWNELSEYCGLIKKIKIFHKTNSPIIFSKENKELGSVIESHRIYNILKKNLLKFRNVTVISPEIYKDVKFLKDRVLINLESNKQIESKLIVASDGKYSKLREKFFLQTYKKKYHQMAMVFNISHPNISHANIAYEIFLSSSSIAILPTQNSNKSSIVWIGDTDLITLINSLNKDNFLSQLNENIVPYLGKEVAISSERFCYNLELILSKNLFYNKMVLIGDSAHFIHPIAGQGFNLTISDIKSLTNLIIGSFNVGLDINSETLLNSYQKERSIEINKMASATNFVISWFDYDNYKMDLINKFGFSIINNCSLIKNFLVSSAGGNY